MKRTNITILIYILGLALIVTVGGLYILRPANSSETLIQGAGIFVGSLAAFASIAKVLDVFREKKSEIPTASQKSYQVGRGKTKQNITSDTDPTHIEQDARQLGDGEINQSYRTGEKGK